MGSEVTIRFRSYFLHFFSCTFGVWTGSSWNEQRNKSTQSWWWFWNAESRETVSKRSMRQLVQSFLNRFIQLIGFISFPAVSHYANTRQNQRTERCSKTQCQQASAPWESHVLMASSVCRHTCVLYRKPFVCCHKKSKALKVSFSPDNIGLTPKDLRWVGAWWLGFLVASCLIFITALPYFFFPRNMPDQVRTKKLTERARIYNSIRSSFKRTFPLSRDAMSLLLCSNHLYTKIFKHLNCFLLSET